jgi:hypothetical protein
MQTSPRDPRSSAGQRSVGRQITEVARLQDRLATIQSRIEASRNAPLERPEVIENLLSLRQEAEQAYEDFCFDVDGHDSEPAEALTSALLALTAQLAGMLVAVNLTRPVRH